MDKSSTAAVVLVLALFMGAAVPAGAVEPPEAQANLVAIEIHPVRVTLGSYIYITWNRTEVRNFVQRYGWVYPGSLAIGNSVCTLVGGFIAGTICRVGVTLVAYSVWTTFTRAAVQGQCVTLALNYNGTVAGLARVYPWQTSRC
jgi:hypothetical protein